MIRSLELAKGTSEHGHRVTLCFMHPAFHPPSFFVELMRRYESQNLSIRSVRQLASSEHAPAQERPGRITEIRPRLRGLIKQILGSFWYLPYELKLFKEIGPDVVVARPDHILSFVLSCRLRGIPLVLDTDGPVEELDYYWGVSSKWLRPIDTWRARRAQAILYISDLCGAIWRGKAIPEDRLFLCPNGADPNVFKPLPPEAREEARRKWGLSGSIVIGFSGNQRKYHGVGNLLQAAIPLLREDPALKILVIGLIQDRAALGLENIPHELLGERIVFTGSVNYADMPASIDLVDIVVMPYPQLELFHFSPMKMFEALAMGKIIVASRQGQIADFLSILDSAFLYDPDRPEALTKAIQRGITFFQSKAGDMNGRKMLIQKHTWLHRGEVVITACFGALRQKHGSFSD